jgi:hypothetical protein
MPHAGHVRIASGGGDRRNALTTASSTSCGRWPERSANTWAGALDQAIKHADTDQWLLASRTDDFAEAVAAFFAKQSPHFAGN